MTHMCKRMSIFPNANSAPNRIAFTLFLLPLIVQWHQTTMPMQHSSRKGICQKTLR